MRAEAQVKRHARWALLVGEGVLGLNKGYGGEKRALGRGGSRGWWSF